MTEHDGLYVDTHAHLDEPAFEPDVERVLARAAAAGVTRVVNIGYRPERWKSTADLAARFPSISIALGLHPQHADAFSERTCDELAEAIGRTGAQAVGEIGLDYVREFSTPERQRHAFAAQLELASSLGLPVVIHQRAAERDCWDMLRAAPVDLPVALHCFEGSPLLDRLGRDRGYYFGVGGLVTKAAGERLRAAVRDLPLDRILLETDAPYLTPSGTKERRNEPANIPRIARVLAELIGIAPAEVAARTTANAERVFRLAPAPDSPIAGDPTPA